LILLMSASWVARIIGMSHQRLTQCHFLSYSSMSVFYSSATIQIGINVTQKLENRLICPEQWTIWEVMKIKLIRTGRWGKDSEFYYSQLKKNTHTHTRHWLEWFPCACKSSMHATVDLPNGSDNVRLVPEVPGS
jgi:hypothetical protein